MRKLLLFIGLVGFCVSAIGFAAHDMWLLSFAGLFGGWFVLRELEKEE